MKNIRSTFAHFRLLNSVLLLVLMLVALAVTPAARASECDWVCSGWDVKNGCVTCNYCCVAADGTYKCEKKDNKDCGTGGPGDLLIE